MLVVTAGGSAGWEKNGEGEKSQRKLMLLEDTFKSVQCVVLKVIEDIGSGDFSDRRSPEFQDSSVSQAATNDHVEEQW